MNLHYLRCSHRSRAYRPATNQHINRELEVADRVALVCTHCNNDLGRESYPLSDAPFLINLIFS